MKKKKKTILDRNTVQFSKKKIKRHGCDNRQKKYPLKNIFILK